MKIPELRIALKVFSQEEEAIVDVTEDKWVIEIPVKNNESKEIEMENKERFFNAKVGDKVVSVIDGEGVIKRIDQQEYLWPLVVRFDNGLVKCFTLGGCYSSFDAAPTLFWANDYVPPVKGKEPVRLPDIPKDTKMFVKKEYLYLYSIYTSS